MSTDTTNVQTLVTASIELFRRRVGKTIPAAEEAIASLIREEYREIALDVPQLECDRLVESVALQHRFPGEYVVFFDAEASNGAGARLQRNVLFHSRDLDVAYASFSSLAPSTPHLRIEYQPHPPSWWR